MQSVAVEPVVGRTASMYIMVWDLTCDAKYFNLDEAVKYIRVPVHYKLASAMPLRFTLGHIRGYSRIHLST